MAKFRIDYMEPALALTTTFASHSVNGVTPRRQKVLEIAMFSEDASDQWARILGRRFRTDAGTSTAVVPTALNDAIPGTVAAEAFIGAAGENHTVEPGYYPAVPRDVFQFEVLFRLPLMYYAPPGAEVIVPALSADGIGYFPSAKGGTTPPFLMAVILDEQ